MCTRWLTYRSEGRKRRLARDGPMLVMSGAGLGKAGVLLSSASPTSPSRFEGHSCSRPNDNLLFSFFYFSSTYSAL